MGGKNGQSVTHERVQRNTPRGPALPPHMEDSGLLEHRREKDDYMGSEHSPLGHTARHGFEGLEYYEPNEDLVFSLRVVEGDHSRVRVQTSDGQERDYERAGTVSFKVGEKEVTLTLYATGHPGYFVPFRDATSGKETYGAGRYLDVEPDQDGTVTINFNYAYNPFCAYNDAYSCPLPPVENWLPVPIEAGELSWD